RALLPRRRPAAVRPARRRHAARAAGRAGGARVRVPAMLASAALVSAVMFTTWALYIMLVEHPARVASGPVAGRAQFRASYQRAAPWQASFAAIALSSGTAAAGLTGHWAWLAGALAVGAAIPLTLLVIRPTNQRLLSA